MSMKLVEKFGIDQKHAEALVKGTLEGAYSLLLGAGASYGCVGGDGKQLKGGVDLAHELNQVFNLGLDEPDRSNLPLAYSDAKQPPHTARLRSFLRHRFSNCIPGWQKALVQLPWKRVWSLNIDDVIEKCQGSTNRRIDSFSWSDPFKPRELRSDELQVIHLHGYAPNLNKESEQLIFSITEYASRSDLMPGWHTEFRSEFSQKPFLVCGARLQEEYDLATVLEYGNRSADRGGAPSFIVLREYAPKQAERFQRQGFLPVKANGDEFFSALKADADALAPTQDPRLTVLRNNVLASFKQLQAVSSNGFKNQRKGLDFYACAEAQWEHIVNDLDARLSLIDRTKAWFNKAEKSFVKFALVSGGPVSGKTTAALRLARDFIDRGEEVWWFRGEQRFDEESLVDYVKRQPKSIFFFDDCADFSSSLHDLSEYAKEQSVKIRAVVTAETNRVRAVEADIDSSLLLKEVVEPLRKHDFELLFTKRGEKGRLGTKSGLNKNEAWQEFKNAYGYKLLEWLESLENANSYREAIIGLFSQSSRQAEVSRAILCATAAVHRFGYSLPFYILDDVKRGESIEGLLRDGGALNQLAYLDDRGLRLRNSAFSRFVWEQLKLQEKYSITLGIARKLAPLVVPQSISQRAIPYLIIRELMDWEHVKKDLGHDAEKWFSELEPTCGWNSRFWEQRALLASDQRDEVLAYSYAKKAIAVHNRDPFPYTTLGKVCLKIATTRGDSIAIERYWEGVGALAESRNISAMSHQEWEHPYITFFSYTIRAAKLALFSSELERMSQAWADWMRSAKASKKIRFSKDGDHNSSGLRNSVS